MACMFANSSEGVARGPEVSRCLRHYHHHHHHLLLVLVGRFGCVSGHGLPVGRSL